MLMAERCPIVKQNINVGIGIEKRPRPHWKRAVLVKTLSIIFGLVFLNTFIQMLVVQKNFELNTERDQIQTLEREINKTQVEIAGLTSSERIQTFAKRNGMKLAASSDYRCIAAAPAIDRSLSPSGRQSMWSRLAGWMGGAGATLANTP